MKRDTLAQAIGGGLNQDIPPNVLQRGAAGSVLRIRLDEPVTLSKRRLIVANNAPQRPRIPTNNGVVGALPLERRSGLGDDAGQDIETLRKTSHIPAELIVLSCCGVFSTRSTTMAGSFGLWGRGEGGKA